MSKDTVIGIDLGTTNSCVAVLDGDEIVIIPNSEGNRTTPSMVGFSESGECLVGHVAKRQVISYPENTVFAIKRLIGRRFEDEEVKHIQKFAQYKISRASNNDAWVQIRGKDYSPAEISAMVLQKMKSTAEDYLGYPVKKAIITVPAYFNDAQRQATKDAGLISELDVERIINEPTAAALAYGEQTGTTDGKIVVYDLGGGTFDISILGLAEGVYEVLSTNGDTFLGGEDFDEKIFSFLIDEFSKTNNIDLRKDCMAMQRLKEAAEKAKHELSAALETEVTLPFIIADQSGPKHLNINLTRAQLEDLCSDIIDRTKEPCAKALQDAGLDKSQIDDIILVGGMTRMPKVRQVVEEFFGKSPKANINPDEVVAYGAALQGAIMQGDREEMLLLDVTPLSLGVETSGGVFTKIIERNTTIPTRRSTVFSTAADNQNMVTIHCLQGEREMAVDNTSLAHFDLVGIPPAPRGVPQIELTFDIDSNGILNVSAKDLGTNKEQSIRIRAQSGLSEDQIKKIIAEAEEHKQEDDIKKEIADLRLTAESLLYSCELSLKEFGEKLEGDVADNIQEAVNDCKEVINGSDFEAIKNAVIRLEKEAHLMTEAIYNIADSS